VHVMDDALGRFEESIGFGVDVTGFGTLLSALSRPQRMSDRTLGLYRRCSEPDPYGRGPNEPATEAMGSLKMDSDHSSGATNRPYQP